MVYYGCKGTKDEDQGGSGLLPKHSSQLQPSNGSFRVQRSHLRVVPREHFLCYGCNVLQEELLPFLFKIHLVHMDIDGGDVLVASLDSCILTKKAVHDRSLRMDMETITTQYKPVYTKPTLSLTDAV